MAHAMTTTDTAREVPAPLEIARALTPRIRKRAAEIEAARQLPRDLVMDIANAGLFKVGLSRAEGGLGADILTTLQVIEEVARADGSTGWCVAMGINSFRQSAQLAPEVRRELFFSEPIGVSAGSARERGRGRMYFGIATERHTSAFGDSRFSVRFGATSGGGAGR